MARFAPIQFRGAGNGLLSFARSSLVVGFLLVALAAQRAKGQQCAVLCSDYCNVQDSICSSSLPSRVCTGVSVNESIEVDTVIVAVNVTPSESELQLANSEDAQYFRIEGKELVVNADVDKETIDKDTLRITIQCKGPSDSAFRNDETLDYYIGVDALNEFPPQFDRPVWYTTVKENAEIGTTLDVNITASDGDNVDTALTYEILGDVPFAVVLDPGTCQNLARLEVTGDINYEEAPFYNITISVSDNCDRPDGTGTIFTDTAVVSVYVEDLDDLPPRFEEDIYEITADERTPAMDEIFSVRAFDQDLGINANISYSFRRQSGDWVCAEFFAIDSLTGNISLVRELDYENALTACNITIQAVQVDNCEMDAEATLTVTVNDLNECPRFVENEFNAEISPDDPFLLQAGSLERLVIVVTDDDLVFQGNFTSDPPDAVKLSLVESTDNGRFLSYFVSLSDPSSITADTIQLFVSDNSTEVACPQAVADISISVLSVGLAPNFTQSEYSGVVAENATNGEIIVEVSAVNSEGNMDGIVYYLQLVSQGGELIFDVDPNSGDISIANNNGLDAETVRQFTLLVEARDESGPYYRSSFASVIVEVLDVNEFSPSFSSSTYETELEEEMSDGTYVLTVQASDSDIDSELAYSINSVDVPFTISSTTGEITTTRRLDLEDPANTEPFYNITVRVSDGTFDNSTYVLITVLDVNDNAPSFSGDEPFAIEIPENELEAVAYNITAYDADETSFIIYQLEDPVDDDRFALDNVTGVLTITGPFDYETESEVLLTIVASDSEFSAQTTVVVSIIDVNDNVPRFTSACPFPEVEEDVGRGTVVCQVVAEDDDEDGMATVNYTITGGSGSGMFEISDMGLISTKTELDRELDSSVTLEITASDYGSPVLSNTTIVNISLVDVNDNPPVFEMTTDDIFVEVDDMTVIPTLLYSVKASDKDQSPFDIIQCEQRTERSLFLVLTSEDGSCYVYSVQQLDASTVPYEVTFDAFNPDQSDEMRSRNFTLNVYVRDTACYISFDPAASYDLLLEGSQLDSSVVVLDLNVTSNCDVDAVEYRIVEQTYQPDSESGKTPSANFTIDPNNGTIFPVDGVLPGAHDLVVVAMNESDTNVNDTASVFIVVTAENNAPYFMYAVYNVEVNTSSGDIIDLGSEAVDPDYPSFATGEVDFTEISEFNEDDKETGFFTVSVEGMVSLTADGQVINGIYRLNVSVEDRAVEPLSNDTLVIIEVDIAPLVDPVAPYISKNCSDEIEIEEEEEKNVPICFVTASPSYDEVVVFGMDGGSDYFRIDSSTGQISTTKSIDFETDQRNFQLLIYAEGTTSKLRNYTTIAVTVEDINDNAPVFKGLPDELVLEEDGQDETECNRTIGIVQTTDADAEENSKVVYQTDNPKFEVRGHFLLSVTCLRRESDPYRTNLTITAVNVGSEGLRIQSTSITVAVFLEDVNDYPPTFKSDRYTVVRSELVEEDTLWRGIEEVDDFDKGPNNNVVVFSFAAVQDDYAIFQVFAITEDEGVLSVRSVENEIITDYYSIKVVATDQGSPPLSSDTTVSVSVVYNSTVPYFPQDERNQEISFAENTPSCVNFNEPGALNDSRSIGYELDVDPTPGEELFYVNCTGPQLCSKELDRETSGVYIITLTADFVNATDETDCVINKATSARKRRDTNDQPKQNNIIFTVTVEDQADSPPAFVFPNNMTDRFYLAAIDSASIGTLLGTIEGSDADATYDLRFSLEAVSGKSDLIDINPVTGDVRTKDLLYPTLADAGSWTDLEGNSEVNYTVSLCDSPSSDESKCVTSPLTFKVLRSFEHIIIKIDESVETVKGKQEQFVRCVATALEIEVIVQFISPRMESVTSTPDSKKTDLWLYAVDPNRPQVSKYMTFQEFEERRSTENLSTCDGTDFQAEPLRLSSARPNLATQALQAWVPLTLALIVFIGNLICILLLWLSWKQMLMDGGNDISRTLSTKEQGIVNPVFNPNQEIEDRYVTTQMDDAAVEAHEEEDEEEDEEENDKQEEQAESLNEFEDLLITKVYLTDGINTTEISLAEGDAPQNAEQIADTEEHNRFVPIPPLMMDTREYETNEATMDVYPFDEPDEELSVTGSMKEEGAVNIIGESPGDDRPYNTKIFQNTNEKELTESPTAEATASESPPHIPDPDYDQAEEIGNGREPPYENVVSGKLPSSPPELPDPDYEMMLPGSQQPATEPTPAGKTGYELMLPASQQPATDPTPTGNTGYENVLLFQPTTIATAADAADAARPDGKTVTFGGETVVGDGASTLDGSTESDSGHSSPAAKHASLPDKSQAKFDSQVDAGGEVIGKMGNDSEPSTVDYLDDESLVSDFSEVAVTSL